MQLVIEFETLPLVSFGSTVAFLSRFFGALIHVLTLLWFFKFKAWFFKFKAIGFYVILSNFNLLLVQFNFVYKIRLNTSS